MSAVLKLIDGQEWPVSVEEAAVQVKIASDLVDCLHMAIWSLDDDPERAALSRVSDIVSIHLCRALQMMDHLMKEGSQ